MDQILSQGMLSKLESFETREIDTSQRKSITTHVGLGCRDQRLLVVGMVISQSLSHVPFHSACSQFTFSNSRWELEVGTRYLSSRQVQLFFKCNSDFFLFVVNTLYRWFAWLGLSMPRRVHVLRGGDSEVIDCTSWAHL